MKDLNSDVYDFLEMAGFLYTGYTAYFGNFSN